MLQNKKILLAITGSIAAYKAATLLRLLIKAGAEVQVIMTPAAAQFITPLTLSTLSRHRVLTAWSEEENWNNHVFLGRWADILLIAPASANTLAKMAQGICDNLLLAIYLSATCPVLIAPAMDEEMWHHPSTKKNIAKLLSYGHTFLPVGNGELASGLFGEGRMAEPENIVEFLSIFLSPPAAPLYGKKALVTAGPTYEAIDPVRFIGNYSSGKMGIAVAESLAEQGASVILLLGPSSLETKMNNIETKRVNTSAEMYAACMQYFPKADITVMAAAVADYRPKKTASQKIKKQDKKTITLELEQTQDILQALGKHKKKNQLLAGFSLETENEKKFALKKLQQKNLDMIVLNSLRDEGAGFQHDTNKITIFDKSGKEQSFPLQSKKAAANEIVAAIIRLQHA